MSSRIFIAAILLALGLHGPAAANTLYRLTLPDAFKALENEGLVIVYSSALVKADMRVVEPPRSLDARGRLEEILRPHALSVQEGPNGSLLIVRANTPAARTAEVTQAWAADVPEVIVEASRYALVRDPDAVSVQLTATDIKAMPNLGEDPLRALARLPGTSGNDFSAQLKVRGGEAGETLVRLDGMRLRNPFHLKDFQAVFSAVDASFVDTIDVYTGAFPASLGDRMSGVIDIKSIRVNERPQREVGLSLFHGTALASGNLGERTDWLVSGRRGNLDLILDLAHTGIGTPSYLDAFGRVTHQFTDELSLAASALLLEDDIRLNDSDLEERAQARYRDRYAWLTLDYAPTNSLSTRMMLSRTQLESHRRGSADQPGIGRGSLEDLRTHGITAFSLDARWRWSDAAALVLGGEWHHASGNYRYRHDAQSDLLFEGLGAADGTEQSREARVTPRGNLYGMYSSLRLELRPAFIVDAGLRWDKSTLPERSDSELSPRISLLYQLDDRTRFRAAWGRHAQMQDIDELQVPDGVVKFFPAQHAEHWVVSLERALVFEQTLRVELYRKNYRKLRPRFENMLNTAALLPELKPDRVRIAPDGATAEGAELSLRRTRQGPVQWWASYTWSRVHDRLGGSNVPRSWDQRHALSAGLSWRNDLWQTSAAAIYHSGWPVPTARLTSDNPPVALIDRGATRLRDYLDIDLRVAREYRFDPRSSLTVFFELSNVIDRHNECCVEYEFEDEEDERFLELERIRALPLLPTLGFTLRF